VDELTNEASMRWMVHPWLAHRSITLLTGPALTAGKTTFVFHLIKALRTGGTFLEAEARRCEVALYTEIEPTQFGDLAYQVGLNRKPELDGVEVLYDCEAPACGVDRLLYEISEHCSGMIDTLIIDSGRLLLDRSTGGADDPRREVGRWLRWAARRGLSVLMTLPTPQGATLADTLDQLGPLAQAVDTVMHMRRTREDPSALLKSPDLFDGERLTKGRQRRLTAASNLGGVPSRSIIRLGPDGYEYVYNRPARYAEPGRELPGAQLSLAQKAG
jgi:hypothetical protein